MSWNAPRFWWRPPGWQARTLAPLSVLYGRAAAQRMENAPRVPVPLPVLCVGNLSVGGSGKTPVAIALAQDAKEKGLAPGFLSRGYGGRVVTSRLVEEASDGAGDVGDEPLLLSRHAPVAVGPERAQGARLLQERGCDFILMDDGFQSAVVANDFALLVIDRRFGVGNGFCLPAGPLRAPLDSQFRHADAVLAMGEGNAADAVLTNARKRGIAVFEAALLPSDPAQFAERRVLAFAGIGHPEKFFRSLEGAGAVIAQGRSFPDHHAFTRSEIAELERTAGEEQLDLVTTAKDAARLRGRAPPGFLSKLAVLEVEARFSEPDVPQRLIEAALGKWARRKAQGLSAAPGPG